VALSATYLADKSALARFPVPAVAARLRPLLEDGELATCAIVDLEVLYSSRNLVDYEAILEERLSLDAAPVTPEVMATAIDLQHERHDGDNIESPSLTS
jgi:predicted nucleic acid-binding protein